MMAYRTIGNISKYIVLTNSKLQVYIKKKCNVSMGWRIYSNKKPIPPDQIKT